MSKARNIIEAAVGARTFADAQALQSLIESDIGARYERPLGDRWNNFGMITSSGSFDHKALEPVTNMQDGVIELLAALKFGDLAKVPYETPDEAARDLLAGRSEREIADDITVTFHEAEPPAKSTKRITIAYRDHGCGIKPLAVANTIFAIGSSHKSKAAWQQGAFGLGGASTYRNAQAVVLVTRRAPKLNEGDDRITVAVVMWQAHGKGQTASYLTTTLWEEAGDIAEPWSASASEFPDFEPGTYLALVSYGVEGYHRARLGDERSFDTALNTRLFQPVTPVRFTNTMVRADRNEYLRGLHRRFEDNPRTDRLEGTDKLPYHVDGVTYHLPVHFYVFSARGEAGERRNFVAYDHALAFTSNGQVHHHWTPQDFRYKTKLNKLYDRVFVVVETDELPIELRTSLFTPDRSHLLSSENALRLEGAVAAFLDEWTELVDINGELIREAITRSASSESAVEVAKQISQALRIRGFALGGSGSGGGQSGGGGDGGGRARKPIDLYPDPTMLEGPEKVVAEDDKTRFVQYTVNAVDDFMPARGQLVVRCDHPEINAREITVGELHQGRVRVSIVVPPEAQEGTFDLTAEIHGWHRAAGGVGTTLTWISGLEVVDEMPKRTGASRGTGGIGKNGSGGVGEGSLVAVVWSSPADQSDWNNGIPGHVEPVSAITLAERPEYAELAPLGTTEIPTIFLNQEYGPYKTYIGARARDLTDTGVEAKKERYAIGVGLGLLYLNQQLEARAKTGERVSEHFELDAKQAVARSVLTMMPAFDRLVSEAGVIE
jgi:hypothetical protein